MSKNPKCPFCGGRTRYVAADFNDAWVEGDPYAELSPCDEQQDIYDCMKCGRQLFDPCDWLGESGLREVAEFKAQLAAARAEYEAAKIAEKAAWDTTPEELSNDDFAVILKRLRDARELLERIDPDDPKFKRGAL